MFTKMQTPRTRAEFERAFHFAIEQMRQGKFHLPMEAEEYVHSLRSVRMLPNGRLDFLSVDEQARLHANMTLNMMTDLHRNALDKTHKRGKPKEDDQIALPNVAVSESTEQRAGKKKAARKKAPRDKLSKKKITKNASKRTRKKK